MSTAPSGHAVWPCIAAARSHDANRRLPFLIDGVAVGSVDRAHLNALAAHAATLRIDEHGVALTVPAAERSAALTAVNRQLHAAGVIPGWRDETYAIVNRHGDAPFALIERAASRFWGTLTFGAHCNGYVADAAGRPTHLWVARRSLRKHTDPGLLDNLVGGGVPWDQTPFETLLREGWEEAGLPVELMQQATPGRVIRLYRDIPEGLQHEHLYVYDLALPAGLTPVNQDGEVGELRCLPVPEALALAAGREMTVDAAMVTLDFALRQAVLPPDEHEALGAAARSLFVDGAA